MFDCIMFDLTYSQLTKHLPSQLHNEQRRRNETCSLKPSYGRELINLIGETFAKWWLFYLHWLDLSPVITTEETQSSANMSTQSRRGRLKRQDTPINVDNREKVTTSHFMKKCLSRRSLSSPSSQRTSSCDEKQHSPKCPRSLTDQQTKGLSSTLCQVNSNPSSSASSAPR